MSWPAPDPNTRYGWQVFILRHGPRVFGGGWQRITLDEPHQLISLRRAGRSLRAQPLQLLGDGWVAIR